MVMVGTAAAVGTAAVLKVVAAAGFVVVMVVVVVVDRRGAVALRMYVPKVEIEILEGWGGAVGTWTIVTYVLTAGTDVCSVK